MDNDLNNLRYFHDDLFSLVSYNRGRPSKPAVTYAAIANMMNHVTQMIFNTEEDNTSKEIKKAEQRIKELEAEALKQKQELANLADQLKQEHEKFALLSSNKKAEHQEVKENKVGILFVVEDKKEKALDEVNTITSTYQNAGAIHRTDFFKPDAESVTKSITERKLMKVQTKIKELEDEEDENENTIIELEQFVTQLQADQEALHQELSQTNTKRFQ